MIEIRPGTDADKGQILARMEEVYGRAQAREAEVLWRWRWHQDPRLPAPGYRGVVAEWRGQIIGNLATIPAGLHIGGEPVTAWWFVDVLVHWGMARQAMRELRDARRATGRAAATHRNRAADGQTDLSRGLAAALFDHPAAGPIQLGKHVNDQMAVIGDRVGFDTLPGTGSLHRRVSVGHPLGLALGSTLGDGLALVVDGFLGPRPRPRLPVSIHDGPFDARFDVLWNAVKGAWPALCRRDAAVLNWRYRGRPDGEHRVLTLAGDEGLRGYCVLRVFERGRRRRGKLLDLLTAPDDRQAQRALLAGALKELRWQRAERVECFVTDAGLTTQLRKLGFTTRTSRSGWASGLMTRNLPDGVPGLYVTQGDGDGG